ncbi:ComEC/Rec2 family competence protein [Novosphingobium sediminis]|uniref:ComEC/Rec2 family competence protein n=1 Tax=Novosphingobium sediminis TaxID=707214 RepID=UPI0011BFBCD9|nr:MBL fold metallo-hydrolase [Novosphingobium sediminis]
MQTEGEIGGGFAMSNRCLLRIVTFLLVTASPPALASPSELEIVNIRIGQGDATLVQGPADPHGKRITVLFDAGDDADYDGSRIIAAVLSKRRIRHIDYVVISHYDADHIGGVITDRSRHGVSFLYGRDGVPGSVGDDDNDGKAEWVGVPDQRPDPEEFGTGDDITVGTFVDRGDEENKDTPQYRRYVEIASAKGNRFSLDTQSKLNSFTIDLGGGASMVPLASSGRVRGAQSIVPNVDTENERSVSMLVTFNKFDFLVSGDLIGRKHGAEDAQVERAVGQRIANDSRIVDVLHVNHHGANNASDETFLELIRPTIAVISHGNVASYKHPNVNALARLEAARVYRIIQTKWGTTDVSLSNTAIKNIQAIYQGDVVISSDGEEYTVSTSRTYRADTNPRRP